MEWASKQWNQSSSQNRALPTEVAGDQRQTSTHVPKAHLTPIYAELQVKVNGLTGWLRGSLPHECQWGEARVNEGGAVGMKGGRDALSKAEEGSPGTSQRPLRQVRGEGALGYPHWTVRGARLTRGPL